MVVACIMNSRPGAVGTRPFAVRLKIVYPNSSSRLEISLLMFEVDVKRFLAAADMERWH